MGRGGCSQRNRAVSDQVTDGAYKGSTTCTIGHSETLCHPFACFFRTSTSVSKDRRILLVLMPSSSRSEV